MNARARAAGVALSLAGVLAAAVPGIAGGCEPGPAPLCAPLPPFPQPPNLPQPPLPPLPPIPAPPGLGDAGPWIPANAGLMWFEGSSDLSLPDAPAGEPDGALWLTRRLATHPYVTGLTHVGTLLHGMYVSVAGGAWLSVTPGCLLPQGSPLPGPDGGSYQGVRRFAIELSGIDVCSIESVAHDPLFPYRLYATGYDFEFPGTLHDGGVYVSDDLGLHWRKAIGGLRGNGLAVGRRTDSSRATIVAGFIQANNGSVGSTPGGGSLVISHDDGESWRSVVLPPSGCADVVQTSQRITPAVRMHPLDASRIYVGTNAGLYVSTDAGTTWRLAMQACGGTWGLAVSFDGARVAVGDHLGRIWVTDRDASSFSFAGSVGGERVQDVAIDPLNHNRLYAATWEGSSAAVYRVNVGGGVRRLTDPNLRALDDAWPQSLPQPFPFSPESESGSAPALFLTRSPGRLMVSTLFRGVFVRAE